MLETLGAGAVAFVATNVDEIVVLAVLFARRDERFGTAQIVGGMYAGFGVLLAASFAVSAGLLALPEIAVALLGLVPIALGIRGLIRARQVDTVDATPLGVWGVATLAVANGADNVAVYAPLFATFGLADAALTAAVFFALTGALCWAGLAIGSRPAVIRAVDRAGDYAIPVVLILLGVFIIAEAL